MKPGSNSLERLYNDMRTEERDVSNARSGLDKVAIITGAGSGIGRAVALAMRSVGYSVVLAGRRIADLEQTAAMADDTVGKMLAVSTDVSQPDAVRALFVRTRDEFGRLDILFNNAGVDAPGIAIEDLSYDQWSRVVSVNLTGTFLCAQEAIRLMKGAAAARRAHYQQRLAFGSCAPSPFGAIHRH